MKRFITLLMLFVFMLSANVFAQQGLKKIDKKNNTNSDLSNLKWGTESHVIMCSEFHVTKPLRDMPDLTDEQLLNKEYPFKEWPDKKDMPVQTFEKNHKGNDPSIIQTEQGKTAGKAPIQNWDGQNSGSFRPHDPTGAAGPNHYLQAINGDTYKIWNKTGTVLKTGTISSLWSPADGDGDPVVLYDKDADRFFMAQFAGGGNGNDIFIGVSTSPDPTSTWYTYKWTSPDFPDYLKFSAWWDGYYMTANYAQKIFAFNRAKILAGDGTAEAVYQTYSPNQSGFFVPSSADASDGTMPTSGPCPVFSYQDDGWTGVTTDAINIYNAAVTWNGGSSVLNINPAGGSPVATNAFDGSYDSSWDDVAQPGTSQKLDGIGGAMMFRTQWKTWSGYNTAVMNWAVQVTPTQRGIFWCELRQDQTTGNWSMYQQGIYAPGTDNVWMGSIAMNDDGNIALAYNKTNVASTVYMSLAYAGRLSCDPLGTLPIAEVIAMPGAGYQTSLNRVGDYAHTCLDPDGVTFWHTGEYIYQTASYTSADTRVYSFQLPGSCVTCTQPTTQATSLSFSSITNNSITASWTQGNGDADLVVVKEGSAVDQDPTSGTSYTANTTFGSGTQIGVGNYVVSDGTTGSVTVNGLTSGATYHFAIYTYNSIDNCYLLTELTGNATTLGPPSITTDVTSAITGSSATSGGNVTSDNGSAVTTRGVCWNTTGTPTTADSKTSDGTGAGTFTSSLTGLSGSTTYYVRAYATNTYGTAYGNEETFTTLCGSYTLPYSENFDSGDACWDGTGGVASWFNLNPASGDHTGGGTCFITNGNNDYTNETYILTSPVISTANYTSCQLTFWMWMDVESNSSWYDGGFLECYDGTTWTKILDADLTVNYDGTLSSSYSNPYGGEAAWSSDRGWTLVTVDISAYDNNSSFQFRYKFAGDNSGYNPGWSIDDINITGTAAGTPPIVSTQAVNSISCTTATGNGNITNLGSPNPTAYGVCWNTTGTPTTGDSNTNEGGTSSTGAFTSSMTGLTAGTTYYVRAYATNTAGTSYGSEVSFTTDPTPGAAGSISGTATVCQGDNAVAYNVGAITDATSYTWTYSGTGATISGTTNSITIDFNASATSGNLTVYGTNACGNGTVSSNYAITVNNCSAGTYTISGTVKYDDVSTTIVNGETVELYDNVPSLVATTTTDASGAYSFSNVADGDYTVKPAGNLAWGGATAMDVTLYKMHLGSVSSLTGLKLTSGDVNASGALSTSDLTTDLQRIVTTINSFPAGDWAYTDGTVTVNGANETVNLSAICYGDANTSRFGAKSLQTIAIENNSVIYVEDGDYFELQINLQNNITDLSSVTLNIPFDASKFEITNVSMENNNSNMYYNVSNGVLKIAYSSLNINNYVQGDKFLKITGFVNNILEETNISNSITGEFGDYNSNVINSITFAMPSFSPKASNVSNLNKNIYIYPNPANNFLNILNAENSKIEVLNILGSKVLITQDIDKYNNRINTQNLVTGTYILKVSKNNKVIMKKFTIIK